MEKALYPFISPMVRPYEVANVHSLSRKWKQAAVDSVISFAVVIRVVTQQSSPLMAAHSSSAFSSLCYREPITCMYLLAAAPIISCYIYRQRPGFQKIEAFSLLVNLRERNVELEWADVSGEGRCVTTLITAAKETMRIRVSFCRER